MGDRGTPCSGPACGQRHYAGPRRFCWCHHRGDGESMPGRSGGSGFPRAGGIQRVSIRSVSNHVVRRAHCSVLLAKCPPKGDLRILLAFDGSAHAGAAIRWLKELDLSAGAWIHVVTVLQGPKMSATTDDGDRQRMEEVRPPHCLAAGGNAREEVGALAGQSPSGQAVRMTAAVRRGHAASEILAAVREFDPELLVLGARGQHSPAESPLGSVAAKVIGRAPCSAVIVRG